MLDSRSELWRPPVFGASNSFSARMLALVRRFFDLQAASIWCDMKALLSTVEGTVVDAGCGAQPYRCLIPEGVRYVGIDSASAGREFGYCVPDTRYFEGPTWPVDEEEADWVICTEALEHIPEPAEFLAEARRCLVPRGSLIITVPFAARWHYIPYDYWRFTPSGLEKLLRESGFENVTVYARGNAFTVACYKNMAVILRLAMPQCGGTTSVALRVLSLPLLPLLAIFAAAAHVSLLGNGGDDCLGYTAAAQKAP